MGDMDHVHDSGRLQMPHPMQHPKGVAFASDSAALAAPIGPVVRRIGHWHHAQQAFPSCLPEFAGKLTLRTLTLLIFYIK
jgi:hypothetical protein